MRKKTQFNLCDRALLAMAVIMLVSGIQLEIISGASTLWIWIHIAAGALFFALTGFHIHLHYPRGEWLGQLWKNKSGNIRWMTAIGFLTLLSGLITTGMWLHTPVHTGPGALHGKLGFLLLIVAGAHILRHRNFYRRPPRAAK